MKNYVKPDLEKVMFASENVAVDMGTGYGDIYEPDDGDE